MWKFIHSYIVRISSHNLSFSLFDSLNEIQKFEFNLDSKLVIKKKTIYYNLMRWWNSKFHQIFSLYQSWLQDRKANTTFFSNRKRSSKNFIQKLSLSTFPIFDNAYRKEMSRSQFSFPSASSDCNARNTSKFENFILTFSSSVIKNSGFHICSQGKWVKFFFDIPVWMAITHARAEATCIFWHERLKVFLRWAKHLWLLTLEL